MHKIDMMEFNIDNFCLKVSILGSGSIAIVIGSHKYYPSIFSENLISKLQLVCVDTRAFVPDNPMYKEADFTLDKIIQDIEKIRKALNLDKVIIIGHSIHAFMALEYARRFSEHVSQLVLIAQAPIAGPKIYTEADRYFEESACLRRKDLFAYNMRTFMQSSDKSFVARMLALGPRLWYNYDFDASNLWNDVTINTIGAGIIWGSMFVNYDTSEALKSIKSPIFLALGRYDYLNPPDLWEDYRDLASDLTIRVFEKSGHTPSFEEKEHFDTELINWLEQKLYTN